MGSKSEAKRAYILKTAREVFASKGYKDVTMKDIVDACGISRGGLYLYYASTEEILLALLKKDAERYDGVFEEAVQGRSSCAKLLAMFLKEKEKEALKKDGSLGVAIYEYGFSKKDDGYIRDRFEMSVRTIEYLLKIGRKRNELTCQSPHEEAVSIMLVMEGLKICARTARITRKEADSEIRFILDGLGIEEDVQNAAEKEIMGE